MVCLHAAVFCLNVVVCLCARATCANHGRQRIPVLLRVLTSSNASEEQVRMVSLPRKMRPVVGKVARNHLAVPGMQQRWPSREFRRYARPADGRIPCTSVAHMECEFSGVCVLGGGHPVDVLAATSIHLILHLRILGVWWRMISSGRT